MKFPHLMQRLGAVSLALWALPSLGQGEIYKWVDAKGKTHYSSKKEEAGAQKVEEIKVKSQPTSVPAVDSAAQERREYEREFQRQREQKLAEKQNAPPAGAQPKSLSNGRSDDTAASKCNLARDVLSGAVRHSNGAPTDKYDREVATNDVKAFCR